MANHTFNRFSVCGSVRGFAVSGYPAFVEGGWRSHKKHGADVEYQVEAVLQLNVTRKFLVLRTRLAEAASRATRLIRMAGVSGRVTQSFTD